MMMSGARAPPEGGLDNLIINGDRRKRSAAMLRSLSEGDDALPEPQPKVRSLLNRTRTFVDEHRVVDSAEAAQLLAPMLRIPGPIAPVIPETPSSSTDVAGQVVPASKVSDGDNGKVSDGDNGKVESLLDAMLQRDLERAAAAAAAAKLKRQAEKKKRKGRASKGCASCGSFAS